MSTLSTFDLLHLFEDVAVTASPTSSGPLSPLDACRPPPPESNSSHAPSSASRAVSLDEIVSLMAAPTDDIADSPVDDVAIVNVAITASGRQPAHKDGADEEARASPFAEMLVRWIPALGTGGMSVGASEAARGPSRFGTGPSVETSEGDEESAEGSIASRLRQCCGVHGITLLSCRERPLPRLPAAASGGAASTFLHVVHIAQEHEQRSGDGSDTFSPAVKDGGASRTVRDVDDGEAASMARSLLRAAMRILLREDSTPGPGTAALFQKPVVLLRFWLDLANVRHDAFRRAWSRAVARYERRYVSASAGNVFDVVWVDHTPVAGGMDGTSEMVTVHRRMAWAKADSTEPPFSPAAASVLPPPRAAAPTPSTAAPPSEPGRDLLVVSTWTPKTSDSLFDLMTSVLTEEERGSGCRQSTPPPPPATTLQNENTTSRSSEAAHDGHDVSFANLVAVGALETRRGGDAQPPPHRKRRKERAGVEEEASFLELFGGGSGADDGGQRADTAAGAAEMRRQPSRSIRLVPRPLSLPNRMATLFLEVTPDSAPSLGDAEEVRRLFALWSGFCEVTEEGGSPRQSLLRHGGGGGGDDDDAQAGNEDSRSAAPATTLQLPPPSQRLIVLIADDAAVMEAALLSWTRRAFAENALMLPLLGLAPPPSSSSSSSLPPQGQVGAQPTALSSAMKRGAEKRLRTASSAFSSSSPPQPSAGRGKGRKSVSFDVVPTVVEAEPWEAAAGRLAAALRDFCTAFVVDFRTSMAIHASPVGNVALERLHQLPASQLVPSVNAYDHVARTIDAGASTLPSIGVGAWNAVDSVRAFHHTLFASWCALAKELEEQPRRPGVALHLAGPATTHAAALGREEGEEDGAATRAVGGVEDDERDASTCQSQPRQAMPKRGRRGRKRKTAHPSAAAAAAVVAEPTMAVGLVCPASQQGETLASSSQPFEARRIAAQAPPLFLPSDAAAHELRQALFSHGRAVFGPSVFHTAVDTVRTAGADYLTDFQCSATGYLCFRVSASLRHYVCASFSVNLQQFFFLHRTCSGRGTSRSVPGSAADVTGCEEAGALLRELRCTCTPRPHEKVRYASSTGSKLCRHLAQLFFTFIVRQVRRESIGDGAPRPPSRPAAAAAAPCLASTSPQVPPPREERDLPMPNSVEEEQETFFAMFSQQGGDTTDAVATKRKRGRRPKHQKHPEGDGCRGKEHKGGGAAEERTECGTLAGSLGGPAMVREPAEATGMSSAVDHLKAVRQHMRMATDNDILFANRASSSSSSESSETPSPGATTEPPAHCSGESTSLLWLEDVTLSPT